MREISFAYLWIELDLTAKWHFLRKIIDACLRNGVDEKWRNSRRERKCWIEYR
jgi:hypothetical protein